MNVVGQRLRELRLKMKLSQAKAGAPFGICQSSMNRYENGSASPSFESLVKMADYYDVSLDYLFGRTDDPHGMYYDCKPKLEFSHPEMKRFIEMCFDPGSPMNERLKETLLQMMEAEYDGQ